MPLFKRLNDTQLTEAIRRGDKEALLQVYRDSYISVRNYILKNNGNSDDAEDVLQDAAIVVWEKIRRDDLELRAKLSTLVFAIAKNLWLKRLGKLGRQVDMDGINPEILSDDTPEMHNLDRKKVVEAMQMLGDKCRELLTLFYFDGLDMNRIASIMNYSNADTAKAKKHQCFRHLREQFLKLYDKSDFI